MNAKQLYNEKLLVLATMSGLISKLRAEVADLTTIEERILNFLGGEVQSQH